MLTTTVSPPAVSRAPSTLRATTLRYAGVPSVAFVGPTKREAPALVGTILVTTVPISPTTVPPLLLLLLSPPPPLELGAASVVALAAPEVVSIPSPLRALTVNE